MTEEKERRHSRLEKIATRIGLSTLVATAFLYFADQTVDKPSSKHHLFHSNTAYATTLDTLPNSFQSKFTPDLLDLENLKYHTSSSHKPVLVSVETSPEQTVTAIAEPGQLTQYEVGLDNSPNRIKIIKVDKTERSQIKEYKSFPKITKKKLRNKFERMPQIEEFGPQLSPITQQEELDSPSEDGSQELSTDIEKTVPAQTELVEPDQVPEVVSQPKISEMPTEILELPSADEEGEIIESDINDSAETNTQPADLYTLPDDQLKATDEDYARQKESLLGLLSPEEKELRKKYGDTRFTSVEEMPDDFKIFYLGKIDEVAAEYDVAPATILAYLYAEQMGSGFGFESRTSSAYAVGEGQITRGHWNGWTAWNSNSKALFQTDLSQIDGQASANDANGDGIANIYDFEENISATAWDISRNGLALADLRDKTAAERLQAFQDALAIYNSGKPLAKSPAETRPYVKIGKDFITSFDPGLFEDSFAYKEQLLEIPEPVQEIVAAPEVSLEILTEAYKKYFENNFGVPFTDTERYYIESQSDLMSEYLKTGDLTKVLQALYDRQVAASYANPDHYPYYLNDEYYTVQTDALESVGAQLGTVAEIKALLDWSANNHEGVINLSEIEEYFKASPQAEIYQWLQFIYEDFLQTKLTRAEYAQVLAKAYQTHGVRFIDMPNQEKMTEEQQRAVIDYIREKIISTSDLSSAIPEVIKMRTNAPLGPLFADEEGNTIPFSVRDTIGDRNDDDLSPFDEHGNFNFFTDSYLRKVSWYGIDLVRADDKSATAGTRVISPLAGEVTSVTVGSTGEYGDGDGNSIVIKGTGMYQGKWARILHLGYDNLPTVGQKLKSGDTIGEVSFEPNAHHVHIGISMETPVTVAGKSVTYYQPMPTVLLFGDNSGLDRHYSPTGNTYYDRDLVAADYFKDTFEADKAILFLTPWDFEPDYHQYLLKNIANHYPQVFSILPSVLR